ncbi:type IV pilus assembly protein PilZ [Leptospira inadai serovar Lyme str. 10]|uniref:Type IV pilus assembly protein PilZ n=2 Tax=Leptospira inadai serovar Lyme TaxID=293084 RepID=V6HG16_9LEPT|nr:PilZ domain-containing protein [Leptospira inadai]EQA38913.1 type IV pilus assembly protein PilZ [Leptospira inadai serovar Lyme str. 10]PNV72112.1 PilZ domain-containing protein [Leptospira inadai serovar Lyme]
MDDEREKRRFNSKDIAELSTTFTCKRVKVIGDIINVSEIGMGVLVKDSLAEDLNIGDLIQGRITTNPMEEDSIEFEGMIVRIERPKWSKEPKIVLGIRFVSEISLPDRVSGLIISLDDD